MSRFEKIKATYKKYSPILLLICFVALVVSITTQIINPNDQVNFDEIYPVRDSANYKFINPLLFYQIPSAIKEYPELASKIQHLIDSETGLTASAYYRELDSGRWFGINENEKYTPSSLLKVVVMITYLKKAETDSSILLRKFALTEEILDLINSIPNDQGTKLKLGETYSVNDLIDKMIIDSDNGATYTLISKLEDGELDNVFGNIGLEKVESKGKEYSISNKDYVSFFRILYNASYLNRDMSERALLRLSETNFKDGIVAGMPNSVLVAHKYGEAIKIKSGNSVNEVELHDCGIVYHPKTHYLLCIMTHATGNEDPSVLLQKTSTFIKETSEIVYESVND